MNLLETVKTNPQATNHALTTIACLGVAAYFIVLSHAAISAWLSSLIVPMSIARGIVSAFMTMVHFLRGPVPVNQPSSTVPVFPPTTNTTPPKA